MPVLRVLVESPGSGILNHRLETFPVMSRHCSREGAIEASILAMIVTHRLISHVAFFCIRVDDRSPFSNLELGCMAPGAVHLGLAAWHRRGR